MTLYDNYVRLAMTVKGALLPTWAKDIVGCHLGLWAKFDAQNMRMFSYWDFEGGLLPAFLSTLVQQF